MARKLLFLSHQASLRHQAYLKTLEVPEHQLSAIQFDEMESHVRSKLLPLSIPIVVDPGSRRILGFRVGSMPAKGLLAKISRKKYGRRKDERPQMAKALFSELRLKIHPQAIVTSDQNPKYPGWLMPFFSPKQHQTVKGRRGCITGQGELKEGKFDPLFALNHTCAMIRANVNRLFRRTWCTTKRVDRLAAHLMLYVDYHNRVLVEFPST